MIRHILSLFRRLYMQTRQRPQVEEALRSEYLGTLTQRAQRYLDVLPHGIIAHTHFAPVSAECTKLHRDGHYYGSIALCQAVSEALVRYLCDRNGWQPGKDHEKNVHKLVQRGFISSDMRDTLLEIWSKRDDFHHLNEQIPSDRSELEVLSRDKNQALVRIESEIFAFSVNEGRIIAKYPKYWDTKDNYGEVFLRLHP